MARRRRLSPRRASTGDGFWELLARSIMRSPYATCRRRRAPRRSGRPRLLLQLTPGSSYRHPAQLPVGSRLRPADRARSGPGPISPSQILVDDVRARWLGTARRRRRSAGSSLRSTTTARSSDVLFGPTAALRRAHGPLRADRRSRPPRLRVPAGQAFVDRLALAADSGRPGFPRSVDVLAGGGAAAGRRLPPPGLRRPVPLIAGVLVLTYLLLMRVVPFAAAAAQGGGAQPARSARATGCSSSSSAGVSATASIGLYRSRQVEGWIPIFLFAMLFGLSMDYEVFLVTRMREPWDAGDDNATRSRTGSSARAASSPPRR